MNDYNTGQTLDKIGISIGVQFNYHDIFEEGHNSILEDLSNESDESNSIQLVSGEDLQYDYSDLQQCTISRSSNEISSQTHMISIEYAGVDDFDINQLNLIQKFNPNLSGSNFCTNISSSSFHGLLVSNHYSKLPKPSNTVLLWSFQRPLKPISQLRTFMTKYDLNSSTNASFAPDHGDPNLIVGSDCNNLILWDIRQGNFPILLSGISVKGHKSIIRDVFSLSRPNNQALPSFNFASICRNRICFWDPRQMNQPFISYNFSFDSNSFYSEEYLGADICKDNISLAFTSNSTKMLQGELNTSNPELFLNSQENQRIDVNSYSYSAESKINELNFGPNSDQVNVSGLSKVHFDFNNDFSITLGANGKLIITGRNQSALKDPNYRDSDLYDSSFADNASIQEPCDTNLNSIPYTDLEESVMDFDFNKFDGTKFVKILQNNSIVFSEVRNTSIDCFMVQDLSKPIYLSDNSYSGIYWADYSENHIFLKSTNGDFQINKIEN